MKKRILDACTASSVVGISCILVGMCTAIKSLIIVGIVAWVMVFACVCAIGVHEALSEKSK